MKVSILGTEYDIKLRSPKEDPKLENNWGYNDETTKEIVLDNLEEDRDVEDLDKLDEFSLKVLRHEIIHCFFNESGLGECCDFARNEILVDWIARQLPKVVKACEDAEEQFRRTKQPNSSLVDHLIKAETKRDFIVPKDKEEEHLIKPFTTQQAKEKLDLVKDLIIHGLITREKKIELCNVTINEINMGCYDNYIFRVEATKEFEDLKRQAKRGELNCK